MRTTGFAMLKQDFNVAFHFIRIANMISKSYMPLLVISSLFKGITPFINIIMPGLIINELTGQMRLDVLMAYVAIIIIGNAILNFINHLLDAKVDVANVAIIDGFELHLGKHIMNMDFEMLENPEILDMKEKALYPIKDQSAMHRMIVCIINLVRTAISIIGVVAIIATLNVLLIGVIIIIVILNMFIFKKSQETEFIFQNKIIPLNRGFEYYAKLTSDFSMAKDIRLYNIAPYILKKINAYNKKV